MLQPIEHYDMHAVMDRLLTSSDDLDNLTTPGYYLFGAPTDLPAHVPTAPGGSALDIRGTISYGILIVMYPTIVNGVKLRQQYIIKPSSGGGNEIYLRAHTGNPAAWSPWKPISSLSRRLALISAPANKTYKEQLTTLYQVYKNLSVSEKSHTYLQTASGVRYYYYHGHSYTYNMIGNGGKIVFYTIKFDTSGNDNHEMYAGEINLSKTDLNASGGHNFNSNYETTINTDTLTLYLE